MRRPFRLPISARRFPVAVALTLSILGLMAAGCGRSAPEGAAPTAVDGVEPLAAGVRVISEDSVVAPSPTSAPAPPTVTTQTTVPPASGPGQTYVIEPGDTLSVIAERFGISVASLSDANGITDVDSIRPGQELIIPGG